MSLTFFYVAQENSCVYCVRLAEHVVVAERLQAIPCVSTYQQNIVTSNSVKLKSVTFIHSCLLLLPPLLAGIQCSKPGTRLLP